jgi:hypothetical protein
VSLLRSSLEEVCQLRCLIVPLCHSRNKPFDSSV